jgi:prepilin-type N-terminal cleavage/methylation domain-containing protein
VAASKRTSRTNRWQPDVCTVPRLQVVRQAGVTLTEMLAVVAVVALTAGVAIPTSNPLATISSGAGAAEVFQAIRYAQREAIRTGAWHTVRIDTGTQTLRVYRLTSSGTEDTSNPVVHPIDKRKYDVAFSANGPTRATIVLVDFDYNGGGNTNLNTLSFGPDGTPALLTGSKDTDIRALDAGVVGIKSGIGQRNLVVDNVTGRVSG